MHQKRQTPEEIVSKLRQVDVLVAQGTPVAEAIRAIGVTEVGCDRKLATPLQHQVPHASLGYKPPAPEVVVPALSAWPAVPARRPVAPRPTLN